LAQNYCRTGQKNDSYLDKIVDAGFDGVYLDIVKAYEYFGPDGDESEQAEARLKRRLRSEEAES